MNFLIMIIGLLIYIYSEEINIDEFFNYDDWIIDFNIIRNNIIKIF